MDMLAGGLGFIGYELVSQLSQERDVVILDNRSRVAPAIEDISQVPVVEADLTDQSRVPSLLVEFRNFKKESKIWRL